MAPLVREKVFRLDEFRRYAAAEIRTCPDSMAGMFDNSVVLEVQQATDIVDVIGEHVSLKKKGREMVGLCPFHEDHRPSMNVNPVKQIFKCFSCGAGGDVFKFIQMRENLTFPQAVERLAERVRV